MISSKEIALESPYKVLNIIMLMDPIPIVILETIEFVSSYSSIEGRSVKESSVGSPFHKPVNSGLKFPEITFLSEYVFILKGNGMFKVMEVLVYGVVRGFLNSS